MNGRRAKALRHKAKQALYGWYLSLLDEDQRKELTLDLALQYTPVVNHFYEEHEKVDPFTDRETLSYQCRVSENTLRWFILQEKKETCQTI